MFIALFSQEELEDLTNRHSVEKGSFDSTLARLELELSDLKTSLGIETRLTSDLKQQLAQIYPKYEKSLADHSVLTKDVATLRYELSTSKEEKESIALELADISTSLETQKDCTRGLQECMNREKDSFETCKEKLMKEARELSVAKGNTLYISLTFTNLHLSCMGNFT